MWINKIKKKKLQFTIIALILFMTTGILAACISFSMESIKFVDDYFENDKCPMFMYLLRNQEVVEQFKQDEDLQELTERYVESTAVEITEDVYLKGEKISRVGIFVAGFDNYKDLDYKLTIYDGEEKKKPSNDEVWVAKTFADGFDLDVDDEIQFGKGEKIYKISAIVNVPQCSSGLIDNYFIYTNTDEIENIQGERCYGINLYAKDGVTKSEMGDVLPIVDESDIVWDIDKGTLDKCLRIMIVIFSGVGTACGIVIMIVSMIVIRYLIRATISKEYASIGIYHAIGQTNKQIISTYYIAYAVAGAVGSFAGIFLSRPISIYLIKKTVGVADDFKPTYITGIISAIVAVLTLIVLSISVLAEIKKVKKVSPVEAINMNKLTTKEKVAKSIIPNASSSGATAVNGLVKSKGMTILTVMVLTVAIYMNLFTTASRHTLGKYDEDRHIWENLPDYDAYISINDDEGVRDYLEKNEDVVDFVKMNFDNDFYGIKCTDEGIEEDEYNFTVYENFTEERYKDVPILEGRICTNPHELTMSKALLKNLDKEVGDYITLTGNGKEIEFLIVGVVSSMYRGGISCYINEADVKEFGFETKMSYYLVFLRDGVSYEDFEEDFEKNATTARIYEDYEFIRQEKKVVSGIANPIFDVIIASVSAFSILIIINMLYSKIKENRKKYGILKAMGFSSGYIRRQNLIELTIEYVVAVVFALIMHFTLSPIFFSLACGIKFIRKPLYLTVGVSLGMYLIMIIIARLMLTVVKKISPVELMEE